MRAKKIVGLLCFFLLGASVIETRQSAQAQEYQPQVGQDGKDVIWVPTPQELVDKMLDMAKVTPKDYVIDLGSGDGRTVIAAARRGATALGVEYNPDMVTLSQRRAAAQGVGARATFAKADLFETDLSKATVITMFLLPSINVQLRPKILALRPGTRIVSNTFDMGDWKADEIATISDCIQYCRALLWIVPARVGGLWRLTPPADLSLTQTFQTLSGTFAAGGAGSSMPITNGRMSGDEIRFEAGGARYIGHVRGDTMQGIFTTGGRESAWQAVRTRR